MLITLVSVHTYPSPQTIPLANAFLAAYAQDFSTSIRLIDFFLGDDAATCAAKIAEPSPDAVGFSMYLWNRQLCCEIALELRHRMPDVKLFCGGPEVTADPASVLYSGFFDFCIVGEGEVPFLSLCQTLAAGHDYADIPGVLLPGSIIRPPPPPLANLDAIPSPFLTGVIDTSTNPGILWQLSRGCSFTCDFCFDARGIHGVRHFSLARVEAELHHFAATTVTQVFVLDSTFNRDASRAKKILRLIKKYAPDIHFHFEVRNEFIDRDMAELFARITCSLQIGLQSADRTVLTLVGRSFNKADFTAKIGLLNNSGATFGFDLMYGLPNDTLAGFKNSLDYALSLYPNHLDIFPLAVLPGTRLEMRAAELHLMWDRQPPYLVESSDCFSRSDMAAASELATACDIFYTRGKAVAWFNSVLAVLSLAPSEFLSRFSRWLCATYGHGKKESDFSDDAIGELHHHFLQQLFSTKKVQRFLPLVHDLVAYHHHYAAVLLAPVTKQYDDAIPLPKIIATARFQLSATTRIVNFTYEIEKLLQYGEPRIRQMYEKLSRTGSQAVMYRHNGMVCTESLNSAYIHLLEQLRLGGCWNGNVETTLTKGESEEFILFALEEGIIENV